MKLLANSKNQPLIEHSFQVSKCACYIYEILFKDYTSPKHILLKEAIRYSGLLHDSGKVSKDFQHYLQGDNEYLPEIGEGESYATDNPLHHELSLVIFDAVSDKLNFPASLAQRKLQRELRSLIQYGIYWHHAEPLRNQDFENIIKKYFTDEDRLKTFSKNANTFISSILDQDIELDDDDILDAIDRNSPPQFFEVSSQLSDDYSKWVEEFRDQLDANLNRFIVRFMTIYADRYVSSLSAQDLTETINLSFHDDTAFLAELHKYNNDPKLEGQRSQNQRKSAETFVHYDSNVIMGAAGSGKTRTGLMAYEQSRTDGNSTHSGILWVCPRIAVAQSVLDEIRSCLPRIKVSIVTGESQTLWNEGREIDLDVFKADIVITTIDQVAKWLTSNSKASHFIEYIQRFVIFDEYHELFSIPSLYYISAMLMRLKEYQEQAHLFISATPEPMHLKLICKNDASWQYPVVLQSFNEQPVKIGFVEEIPADQEGALYVFNTAHKAQDSAVSSWRSGRTNIMCYHSKYNVNDKKSLTSQVIAKFGKSSDDQRATLFAGPIAQASLNISRKHLNTELSHPANIIQRIGRSNRFAEYGEANVLILSGTDQLIEKKGQYGAYGKLKNTGSRKIRFNNGQAFSDVRAHYYEKYSYQFYQKMIATLFSQSTTNDTILGKNINTTLNELNNFYRSYSIKQVENGGELVNESREFVSDAIEYLRTVNLYKPTKLTIETAKGREVGISYRGGSLWATMSQINVSNQKIVPGQLIGLPGDSAHLVTINDGDYSEIDVLDNLESISLPEFKPLKVSLSYRARHSGRSKASHLTYLAKKVSYPLVCSIQSEANKHGLYYIKVSNDESQFLNIGFMRLKNGIESIK